MDSTTLQVGDHAPEFSLITLTAQSPVTLKSIIRSGAAILEFIRGTW